jgi:cell wall-associated NlpC family hydrolase
MRIQAKFAIAVLLCAASMCRSLAQDEDYRETKASNDRLQSVSTNQAQDSDLPLNEDDRLSIIAAALDRRVRLRSERDCSHLVHAIYQQAGFPYRYAPSSEIYAGIEGFQRVKQPQPGDLVVWRGHVGIVIKPSRHIFFSFMRSGPGTDDYEASYWKGRGHPRFYRYVKGYPCIGCDSAGRGSRRLVKIKR